MFGYIRPLKSELKLREFGRYRSVYCALCASLGRSEGLLHRLGVNYDATFLALYLLSFRPDEKAPIKARCPINPLRRLPIAATDPAIDFAAQCTAYLLYLKGHDDRRDKERWKGNALGLLYRASARRFRKRWPEASAGVEACLHELAQLEAAFPSSIPAFPHTVRDENGASWALERVRGEAVRAAKCSGEALRLLAEEGIALTAPPALEEAKLRQLAAFALSFLGEWVYLIDALDDLAKDRAKKRPNPFLPLSDQEARILADQLLRERELDLDRHFALLPYCQDAAILQNIICQGLPAERERILKGEKQRPL